MDGAFMHLRRWLARTLRRWWATLRPPSLDNLGLRYLTAPSRQKDKYSGGDKTSAGQGFTAFYASLLEARRHRPHLVFLEIGVWYGKSLAMWADYFTSGSATIIGIDISLTRWHEHRPDLEQMGAFTRNNVRAHQFDTYSDAFASFVCDKLPPPEVILDDGNHTAASQWHLFALLWRVLQSGGIYIIGDSRPPLLGHTISTRTRTPGCALVTRCPALSCLGTTTLAHTATQRTLSSLLYSLGTRPLRATPTRPSSSTSLSAKLPTRATCAPR